MLKKSDCKIPPPDPYPGIVHHKNTGGTLLSRDDWVKFECKKWMDEMQKSEKYDVTYFSDKVHCLKGWLVKTFANVSLKVVKNILYDLESNLQDEDNPSVKSEESDSENSEIDDEMMDEDENDEQNSPDLFASDSEKMEDDPPLTRKGKISTITFYVEQLDENLLDDEEVVPEFVKNSRRYKKRRNEFIEHFVDKQFERYSSQEIASSHSQLPKWVQSHKYIREKFSHRTKEELSNFRILKNLNETCRELKNNPSKAAFDQRVMIVASVICPRYGVPGIDETKDVIAAAKNLKKEFVTGNQTNLNNKQRKKREVFPKSVFDLAKESWETGATVVEPAQHTRPNKALNDGQDTIPNRLQVLTDDEAYEQFKDNYEDKVKDIMKKYAEEKRQKFMSKKESKHKDKVLETLNKMENRFPGISWFLGNKPPQTKANNDHITGNCKDCYSVQLNYESILKATSKQCKCKTDSCKNWQCTCDTEDEETEEDCTCNKECDCDDCEKCQVRYE